MDSKTIGIIGAIIIAVATGGTVVGTQLNGTEKPLDYDQQKVVDCTDKAIQYEMIVQDGDIQMPVYYCDDTKGYLAKKSDIINRIKENRVKESEGVSPSVDGVLIAYNDEEFFEDAKNEFLKKYDPETHTFIGSEHDNDIIEQRAMFFLLADFKCNGECKFTGDNINEWAYNLLTKK